MPAIVDMLGNPSPTDPAVHAAAVTPSDSADLERATTALFLGTIGAAGTLTVVMAGGEKVTFTFGAAASGVVLPIRVVRVLSTGTTVTNIVALWR